MDDAHIPNNYNGSYPLSAYPGNDYQYQMIYQMDSHPFLRIQPTSAVTTYSREWGQWP